MAEPGQKLHIVAVPLHYVFRSISDDDRIYLVSAHVEASESSGLSGLLGHLSGHFSSVANYDEGEKTGSAVLLKGKPSDSKLIDELTFPDEFVHDRYDLLDALKDVYTERPWILAIALLLAMGTLLAEFLGIYDPRAVFFPSLGLPYPYEQLLVGLSSILAFIVAWWFIRDGFRNLPDAEKWGLFIISFGSIMIFAGVMWSYTSLFHPSSQMIELYLLAVHLWILNWAYLLGVLYPRWRLITIFAFTLALEIIFLQWFPNFLISVGIPTSTELQMLLAMGFALLISIVAGLFYNFMKSVELILELEHSFALFVGRSGASRSSLKQKLARIIGIEEKQSLFERITGVVRVYLGFRPQGTIEFHLDLPLDSVSSIDTDETPKVLDYALYPVEEVTFDGAYLWLTFETSSGSSREYFHEFQPQ